MIFILGNHYRLKKQYSKKQQADAELYKQVLQSLNQHTTVEDARKHYHIEKHYNLMQSIKNKTHFPVTKNDQVQILLNGEEKFPSLFQAIQEAKHHVHLLYYTIQDDQIGSDLSSLLMTKAQEGVEVKVLVDGVGSRKFAKQVAQKLQQKGVEVAVFAPPRLSFLFHLNFRNHRKIAVIDGRVGFTGGINIGDEYLHKDPGKGYWRDISVRLEGEAVLLLQRIFATDWYYATNHKLTEEQSYFPVLSQRDTHQAHQQTAIAQIVPSGPDMEEHVIGKVYRDLILMAKEKVWLGTPYFIPDKMLLQALKEARQRGVEIQLIVPQKTDNPIVQAAAFHYYQNLMKAGIKIHLYKKGFYHAKIAIVDDEVVKIGSANMDNRSLKYSFEAGAFIYHKGTTLQLQEVYQRDLEECIPLQPAQINKRTFLQRVGTQLSLLLVPWL